VVEVADVVGGGWAAVNIGFVCGKQAAWESIRESRNKSRIFILWCLVVWNRIFLNYRMF